ncbi:MAG: hypothetical protein SGCHY_002475, partial [Lobulomycetales sp.]
MTVQLAPIDVAILVGFLTLILAIAGWISIKQRRRELMDDQTQAASAEDFFLADRSLPWYAAA